MRRSSFVMLMLVLGTQAGMPAVVRADSDIHSITQRINELRTRLDSFRGVAEKTVACPANETAKAKLAIQPVKDKSLDGEKIVLLPPAGEVTKKTENATPEGESTALEHRQDVKVTVLFHDAGASPVRAPSGMADKKNSREPTGKAASSPAASAKKP